MVTIETVRPGVQFVPDAAAAFRRSNAQVRIEFGRDIDVNSTFRSPELQLQMHFASLAYRNGTGPYPGHSWAVHPKDSFHVAGTALDSDDWTIARIVAILAENGFIRNRLYVPGENHHFEWLRDRDRNYGKPIPAAVTQKPLTIQPEVTIMATRFITTDKGVARDQDRRGAFVDTESGFAATVTWFSLSDADSWAKDLDTPRAVRMTDAAFDKFLDGLAAIRP